MKCRKPSRKRRKTMLAKLIKEIDAIIEDYEKAIRSVLSNQTTSP